MTESAVVLKKFCVSGKVQGVYFRAASREVARRLGLAGWVCNLADGRVCAVAAGSAAALGEFEQWLAQGPPRARVSAVTSEICDAVVGAGFEVR